MILGDFNALSGQHEKSGGRPFTSLSRDSFYQLKLAHGLVDLESSGPVFTWCNGRSERHQIRERLGKGLANREWASLFPRALIRNLPSHNSDHAPILLSLDGAMGAGSKPFRFESCWTRDEASWRVVQEAWEIANRGSPPFRLV